MKQPKLVSLVEAVTNTFVGLFVSIAGNVLAFNALGIKATPHQYGVLVVFMTLLSVGRGYFIRRLFNTGFWKHYVKHEG